MEVNKQEKDARLDTLNRLQELVGCNKCGSEEFEINLDNEGYSLRCVQCSHRYLWREGVLDCTEEFENVVKRTSTHYGEGWLEDMPNIGAPVASWQYDEVIKITHFPSQQEGIGLEGGCGHGKDTVRLAQANPNSFLVSIDLSVGGTSVTASRLAALGITNVAIIRASLLTIPLRANAVDWAYTFGVLHHTPSPQTCMAEIARVTKSGSGLAMYLYSSLHEFPIKRLLLAPVTLVRKVSHRLPLPILRLLCKVLAPFVYLCLTLPARLLRALGFSNWSMSIPHHHNESMSSVVGELYDRLGAQIEFRFSSDGIQALHDEAGLELQKLDQIPIWRGWVSYGINQKSTHHIGRLPT